MSATGSLSPHAAHLEAIFDSAVDFAIITTDRSGLVTAWNPGAERILGWSVEEMLGRPAATFFTPEDRAVDRPGTEMRCALEAGRSADERWHLRKDGSRFWASGELMPLRSPDGANLGFLKILRDRTEATASEDETRRVRDELQVVTDALPVLVSFIDRNHVYRFANRHYETWFERPVNEIVRRPLREVVGDEVYAARLPFMARALAGEEVTFDALMPYKGGASRQSEIRYIPVAGRRPVERPHAAAHLAAAWEDVRRYRGCVYHPANGFDPIRTFLVGATPRSVQARSRLVGQRSAAAWGVLARRVRSAPSSSAATARAFGASRAKSHAWYSPLHVREGG